MHKHSWRHLVGILAVAWYHHPAAAQTLQWARQFASPPAAAFCVTADSSGVYIAGATYADDVQIAPPYQLNKVEVE